MSRSTSRDNSSSVSLFPFLAVLLCTMGGLVVLLVAVSHVSRELAKQEKAKVEAAAATQAAPDEHALAQLAELRRRSDEYARREAEAKDSVRQDRLRLAQVEQHVRKLQDEMEMIQVAARELEADESQRYDDRAQAERELARLEQLIDDTKLEIEQQRKQTEGEKKSYAVVPYKGASGTQRQPIYIECRADRVLLQPEGIELTPDDFATPLGVGNPLAAALRAARDHMVRNNPSAGDDADVEPYPLILIRPEGIGAYYRVREAIRSWDADFGYEMIDGDWDLSFAPPDAQLANVELRAIDNARLRREVLASAAPSAFSGGGGTFAIPAEDEPLSDEYPYDPAMLGGGGTGGGGATLAGHGGGGSYSGRSNGPGSGGGGHPSNSRSGHPGQGQTGQGEPGQGQPGQPGQQWQAGQLGATGWSTGGAPSRAEEGYPEGSSGASLGPGGASPHQTAGAESGGQSQPQGGDSGQPSSNGHPGGSVNGSVAGAAGSGQSSSAGAGGGAASASGSSMGAGGSSGAVASLNDKKGPDDVAIRRAVKVSVFADRLLVGGQAEPLPMPGPTSAHINDFVASVKQQIQSWGLAGSGLYWRPIIKLDVRQGGEQRAAEIERILTRSGIDIEPVQTANLTDREPTSVTR